MIDFLRREWAQVSTKIGAVLTVVGPLLQNYAQFDVKFAYASAGIGVLLILFREQPKADSDA